MPEGLPLKQYPVHLVIYLCLFALLISEHVFCELGLKATCTLLDRIEAQ
jgi:hypothetical protein